MKMTSLAFALAVPAIVVAAEPVATPAADLKEQVNAQARMEASMLMMEHPAPVDKENAMGQIAYIFELCHASNESLVQTAKEITSKETADEKAIELGAKYSVYGGFCIAAAFTGLNADKLSPEDQQKLVELAAVQNQEDHLMSAELKRLEENSYYGSAKLEEVIKSLKEGLQNQPADGDGAVSVETEPADAQCAELQTLLLEQSKQEKAKLLENNEQTTPATELEKVENHFKLFQAANLALLETAKGITDKETAEAKAMELGARCQVYVEMGFASEELCLSAPLTDAEREQLKELVTNQRAMDKATATELMRLKENDFYGSDLLKAVFDAIRRNVKP